MPPTPTLDDLARQFFPHLPPKAGVAMVMGLLDHLNNDVLRQARIESNQFRQALNQKETA